MKFLSIIQHLLNRVDIDSLLREIDSLKKELSSVKKDLIERSASLTSKHNEILSLKQYNESLAEDLVRERNKYSIQEEKICGLTQTVTDLKEKNENLGSSEQKLKDECEKIKTSNISLNGKNLALSNRVKMLEDRIAQMESVQSKLQTELDGKNTELSMVRINFGKLQSEYDKKKDLLNEANSTIESEKADKIALVDDVTQLQEANRILSREIDSLNTKADDLINENTRIKEETLKAKEKINLLTEEKTSLETEKSILSQELDNQKEENDSLHEQIQHLAIQKEDLSPYMRLIDAKKKAIESAIKEEKKKLSDLVNSAKSILSAIKYEIVKEGLEVVIKSSEGLVNSSNCTLQELNDSIISLQLAIQVAENQNEQLIEEEKAKQKEKEEKEQNVEFPDSVTDSSKEENNIKNNDAIDKENVEQDIISETTEEIFDDEDVLKDKSLPYIYDYGLIPAEKLSIPEVYDVKEAKIVNSRDFFAQNENELILWRRNLQEGYLMGRARFICPECKQPVKISGHKLSRGRVCYFAHFKDSDDCPYKTGTNRTKKEIEIQKYSLIQESERHKRLKESIALALKGEKSKEIGVENVECEKRINSDIPYLNWRRPDVYAEYNGRKFVFELQLSTTFVSVIVDRDIFYRLNDYNIIWVFNFEDNKEYVNLHNLMCKDIYYANKRNVFIFDTDTEEKSKERGELILKCRWLDENGMWSQDEYVTLDMFQYDEENHKPFFVDADKAYLEKYPEYAERRKQFEHTREHLLKGLMERQKQEEELENRKAEERYNPQMRLLNEDKCVECFRSGTKYGYQYEGEVLLPAKYTSAENIREDGYAQVGFNRKIGLVRKDGKEIVPVEYKNVDVINNQHGIVMASYKRIDLWLGDECFALSSEYDDKEEKIIKEEEDGKTKYILQSNTYNYTYTSSYYGDHPIRHKNWAGYSKSILFVVLEENDYCIIWVNGKTYLLSRNRLSVVNGNYSDIKSIGIDQLFIAKDLNTNLWGVINLQGKIITEFHYEKLIPTESEYLIAKYANEPNTYGVIDYLGREFIAPQYEALIYLNSERFAFRKGLLWGVCDCMGNILQDAIYTYIRSVSSGSIMASTLESYLAKWKVKDDVPSYEEVKLCLLNENGEIAYTEQDMSQYHIRHSGDLYCILSSNNQEVVNYSLSYVEFINETTAIIKDIEGNFGFFIREKCEYFKGCINIEHLDEDIFKFTNIDDHVAIGNYSGPVCNYSYCDIKNIDSHHFIASQKPKSEWGHSLPATYVIIDKIGNVVSAVFSAIDEFENGFANAVYKGHQGTIDVAGIMQEKIAKVYGDYVLYEKFGSYYFRNEKISFVSDEFQTVDCLYDTFFAIKKCSETSVRIYSLKVNKLSDNSFVNVTHLDGDMFVAQIQSSVYSYSYLKNVYQIYKGVVPCSSECYSTVVLLDNGYIGLQKSNGMGYNTKTTWKISRNDRTNLSEREYDSIIEAKEDSFKVSINGYEGFIDLNGNLIVEKESYENGFVLTRCFADCGLEDKYGNTIISLEEHFSDIEFIEGTLIKVCKNNKYALCSAAGVQITEPKFSSVTYEATNRYAVVEDSIKGHIDSQGNYIETSTVSIPEYGVIIFVVMQKYGLKDSDGNILIPSEYASIKYLTRKLLAVKKDSYTALFDLEGKPLTNFKYSDISCGEDGSIQVVQDNMIGKLDDNGNEIADIKHFNGGYLKSLFGDYSVISDTDEIVIPVGYSKIEILDNDGVFALWKGDKVTIGNISKEKTEPIYESVESIGNGFYVVSRTISKKIRNRHTGYGYRGNPYTYFTSKTVREKKFGIIDSALRIIIPCKYSAISGFDDGQNITTTNAKYEKKSISLQNLKKKASNIPKLSIGTEYDVKVQAFMPIGLIVKIQGNSYVIHRKHLFKEKKDFKKGETFIAKFLGNDQNGHPIWETKILPLNTA